MIRCPVCYSKHSVPFYYAGSQPLSVTNLTSDVNKSTASKRLPINIYYCENCKHVWNSSFDPSAVEYTGGGCHMFNGGEGWQKHIKYWQSFIQGQQLDTIIEIGAGDGEFLSEVKTKANKIAYEPSDSYKLCAEKGLNTIHGLFTPEDIPKSGDIMLVLRHVLEHFDNPREFIQDLSFACSKRESGSVRILVEVPNVEKALRDVRVEDWTYEHAQHFTSSSLFTLMSPHVHTYACDRAYDNEVLVFFGFFKYRARDAFCENLINFSGLQHSVEEGINMLESLDDVVYWGGAGKSVLFLSLFRVLGTVVDSDPNKVGMLVPGTDTVIQDPSILTSVDTIVATTSWRAKDIKEDIIRLGIKCNRLIKFEHGEFVEVPLV